MQLQHIMEFNMKFTWINYTGVVPLAAYFLGDQIIVAEQGCTSEDRLP
jgi:hypothetical protein